MAVSIKTPEQIEKMRIAGRLAAEVLEMIEPHVQVGITTNELDKICHDYIVNEQHAIPAPLEGARQDRRGEVLNHLRHRAPGREALRGAPTLRRVGHQPDPHRFDSPPGRPGKLHLLPRLRGLAGGREGGRGAARAGGADHRAEVTRELPRRHRGRRGRRVAQDVAAGVAGRSAAPQ